MVLEGWSEFFVATAGASAALAGLIIVAMSVNVELMITIPGMTSRAASAIALLVLSTVASLVGLIPHQGIVALGIEVGLLGLGGLGFTIDSMVKVLRARGERPLYESLTKTLVEIIPALAFVVAGVLLALGIGAGAFVLAFGAVAAIMVAVLNAWVVLVEIRR